MSGVLHPFIFMLHVIKDTDSTIYFTGTEMCTLSGPYFLFSCTNTATKDKVNFVIENTSSYPRRYDKGVVDANVFSNFDSGLWKYKVYEQESSTETDVTDQNLVEEGYMYVHSQSVESPSVYSGQSTTYKTYERN